MIILKFALMMVAIWCAMIWGFGAGKYSVTKKSNVVTIERNVEYWMTWGFMMASFICGIVAVLL